MSTSISNQVKTASAEIKELKVEFLNKLWWIAARMAGWSARSWTRFFPRTPLKRYAAAFSYFFHQQESLEFPARNRKWPKQKVELCWGAAQLTASVGDRAQNRTEVQRDDTNSEIFVLLGKNLHERFFQKWRSSTLNSFRQLLLLC